MAGGPGFGVSAGLPDRVLAAIAPQVRSLAYGSFWANDAGEPLHDGLADVAAARRAGGPAVTGVGVLPLDKRTPASIAAHVAGLRLPVGELWLGVGSGGATRPLGVVRSGVADLRRRMPGARIVVAALGPRMLELAGEVADGVLLNWIVPERIPWARAQVLTGAARAGRKPSDIVVWAYVRVAVGPDAVRRLATEASRYAGYEAYGRAFAAMGVAPGHVGIAAASRTEVQARLADYSAALDGLVVRALAAAPTAEAHLAVARAAAPRG